MRNLSLALLVIAIAPNVSGQLLSRSKEVERSVNRVMNSLPKEMRLKPDQKTKLRKLLAETAGKQQDVMKLSESKFEQRHQIAQISADFRKQLKLLLTPSQLALFNRPFHIRPPVVPRKK